VTVYWCLNLYNDCTTCYNHAVVIIHALHIMYMTTGTRRRPSHLASPCTFGNICGTVAWLINSFYTHVALGTVWAYLLWIGNLGSLLRLLGCGINSSARPIIGLRLMLKSFLARQAERPCFLCSPPLLWLADSQWLEKHHRSICESAHHRTDCITKECQMLSCMKCCTFVQHECALHQCTQWCTILTMDST